MSSESEENMEFLREAIDQEVFENALFSKENSCDNETTQKLPSLRNKQDENDRFNLLQVTPAFQKYVAKQLSAILEKKLSKNLIECPNNVFKQAKNKSRVKLFKNSASYLKVSKTYESQQIACSAKRKQIKKRKIVNEYESSSEDEENKLKTAAVSPEDILNKKDVQFWSKRSKASVFRYKKTTTGQLILIEPQFK